MIMHKMQDNPPCFRRLCDDDDDENDEDEGDKECFATGHNK